MSIKTDLIIESANKSQTNEPKTPLIVPYCYDNYFGLIIFIDYLNKS